MKAAKEMARTKLQLDTSLEVENRLGNSSSRNSNNPWRCIHLPVIQLSYIYRYIDCESLTGTPESTPFGPIFQCFCLEFVCHFSGSHLNNKFSDGLTSVIRGLLNG